VPPHQSVVHRVSPPGLPRRRTIGPLCGSMSPDVRARPSQVAQSRLKKSAAPDEFREKRTNHLNMNHWAAIKDPPDVDLYHEAC